MTTFALWA